MKRQLFLMMSIKTVVIAYLPSTRRVRHHHQRKFAPSRFPCTKRNKAEDGLVSSSNILDFISYRKVSADDIPECYKIESASYPKDEAASLDNLYYRQQYANDYFWCATLPTEMTDEYITAKQDTADDNIMNNNKNETTIIGFVCSTRCKDFIEESMSKHDQNGTILAIHSVVVDVPYRRMGIASAMLQSYHSNMLDYTNTKGSGFQRIMLLAKSHLLGFYVNNGFTVLRPSPIVHGVDTWYELESRDIMMRMQQQAICTEVYPQQQTTNLQTRILGESRSTANPDESGGAFAEGHEERCSKLHIELAKLDIDPTEIEANPESFGTAAMRTYNSFLLPKSKGALATANSPTRPKVVANNISFLMREHKADQENWLRNVDQNRIADDESKSSDSTNAKEKHPITIVLDNIRSAHNVGNILRLAEAAQVAEVRLCGMTPRPPHRKLLKTAMGAAEYIYFGDEEDASSSTLQTVKDLKKKGYKVLGVETTENATSYWDTSTYDNDTESVCYVFGNELIGVDIEVLRECDEIICLPTYGIKNSLNVATCVGIVVWDRLRRLMHQSYN